MSAQDGAKQDGDHTGERTIGGRYRVVGGTAQALEGEWTPAYPVIIEFDSRERAQAWYDSEEYAPLKRLRQSAVTCNGVLIEGLPS